jgi:hypothetical protein
LVSVLGLSFFGNIREHTSIADLHLPRLRGNVVKTTVNLRVVGRSRTDLVTDLKKGFKESFGPEIGDEKGIP